MLKRRIAILIGVGLLGAQVTMAGAEGISIRFADDGYQPLPAQEKYFAERAASNPNLAGVSGRVFPPSADDTAYWNRLPAQEKYFAQRAPGNQGASAAQAAVKVTASTKYINVGHLETVKIENDKGQSFVWKADTLSEADLPLQAIAPKDFAAGQTRVFVRHPYAHLLTD